MERVEAICDTEDRNVWHKHGTHMTKDIFNEKQL